jgi:hypothetical protein
MPWMRAGVLMCTPLFSQFKLDHGSEPKATNSSHWTEKVQTLECCVPSALFTVTVQLPGSLPLLNW